MVLRLFRRPNAATIDALYGAIVAQARSPIFYAELGVPDTVEGRFDMVVLHLMLVLRRLLREPQGEGAAPALAQGLFDAFCRDMDHNLREMGVGDLSVPKEMQRMGEAFYGRAQAYRTAMRAVGEEALAEVVVRNIYGGVPPIPAAPARLAAYIREVAG